MKKYLVKNWDKFQHYKDRRPPWIKLHRVLLDDCDFIRLPVASRAIAPLIWLLASESYNGSFDGDVAFRLRLNELETAKGIKGLLLAGYITEINDASNALAGRKRDTRLETETETETERETETDILSDFESIWNAYPRKIGKQAAFKAWKNSKNKPDKDAILSAIESHCKSEQWQRDNGQFIPHLSKWLNQGRWDDQMTVKLASVPAEKPLTDWTMYELTTGIDAKKQALEAFPESASRVEHQRHAEWKVLNESMKRLKIERARRG